MISIQDLGLGRSSQVKEWNALGESGSVSLPSWLETGGANGTPTFSYEQRSDRMNCLKLSPESTTTSNDAYVRTSFDITPSNFSAIRWRAFGVESVNENAGIQFGFTPSSFASTNGVIYYDRGALSGLGAGPWQTAAYMSDSGGDDTAYPIRYSVSSDVPNTTDSVYATPKDIAITVIRRRAMGSGTVEQYVRFEVDENIIYEQEHGTAEMGLAAALRCVLRTFNVSTTQCHLWVAGVRLEVWV